MILASFGASLLVTIVAVILLIPRLHRAGITGKDMNKPRRNKIPRGRPVYPEIPEMGGLAIVAGTGVGISVALAMMSFFHVLADASTVLLLAALAVILLTGLIGIIDDLLGGCSKSNPVTTPPEGMRQLVKAFLPSVAALSLVAVRDRHRLRSRLSGGSTSGFSTPCSWCRLG